jgi:hypothetical protein
MASTSILIARGYLESDYVSRWVDCRDSHRLTTEVSLSDGAHGTLIWEGTCDDLSGDSWTPVEQGAGVQLLRVDVAGAEHRLDSWQGLPSYIRLRFEGEAGKATQIVAFGIQRTAF